MARTVLCVDDDRSLCQIMAKALSGAGFQVVTAYDGEEAVARVAEDPPDLVLLDLLLPRRDGFAVLEAIRAMDEPVRDVPVVVVTGCSPTPEYRARAAHLGALEMLTKPVPLDQLLAVACAQLGKSEIPVVARRGSGTGLAGSLERLSFPWLLHHLHGMRASGVLHVTNGRKRKWLQLRGGYAVAVRSNLMNECLGNFLVRTGRITRAHLDESVNYMRAGRLQGEILVAMDVLSEEDLSAALRAQAEEKLFELFEWREGTFRFELDGHLQRANVLGLERSPASLILEGVRTRFPLQVIDRYLEANRDYLVTPCESPFYRFQEFELESNEESLLRGLDGTRRLAEYLGEEPELRRALYGFLATGLLELRAGRAGGEQRVVPQRGLDQRAAERAPRQAAPQRRENDHLRSELAAMAERFRRQDYYEILGVAPDASAAALQDAFVRLASRTHPDQVGPAGQAVKRLAEEVFAKVEKAYQTLTDPRRRQEYELERRKDEREAAEREESRRALDAELVYQDGTGRLQARDYEGALRCFGKALELYSGEGEYHAHYGWALYLCNQDDPGMVREAIEHVRRGVKLASHREKPYLYLGRLYKVLGRVGAAQKMFARAVQIQPECVEALREIRLINMRRKGRKGIVGRLLRR